MKRLGTMRIEQVIGPRLERGGIVVVETQTPFGRVALELSLPAADCLHQALRTAMAASAQELPQFLAIGSSAEKRDSRGGLFRAKRRLSVA